MPTRNASLDRSINFVGGRILEADEINRIQQMAADSNKALLSPIYPDGYTLNCTVSVSGVNVSLSATDNTLPMVVFVNGRWEAFSPITLSFQAGKTSGTDYIYLNWTIWKVTASGSSGTIADAGLVDGSTGEPVAEIGQLELRVETSDNSATSLNATTMLDKNMSPIPMFSVARGTVVACTVAPVSAFSAGMASHTKPGLVTLSTGTSTVAVATDDSRLGAGPGAGSIATSHISDPAAASPAHNTTYGPSAYDTTTTAHGIKAAKLIHSSSSMLVEDALTYLISQVQSLTSRITSLEGAGSTSTTSGSYAPASHVGTPLGQSTSHPPTMVSDNSGFEVTRASSGAGSSTDFAFRLKDSSGSLLFGVGQDGDIYSKAADTYQRDSTNLGKLSVIAQKLAALSTGGTGGVLQSYVDTADAGTLTSAKAYTDAQISAHPASVTIAYPTITSVACGSHALDFTIFTIGNLSLGFFEGDLQDGDPINMPAGFSQHRTSIAGQHFWGIDGVTDLHASIVGGKVNIYAGSSDNNHIPGAWARVSGMTWKLN